MKYTPVTVYVLVNLSGQSGWQISGKRLKVLSRQTKLAVRQGSLSMKVVSIMVRRVDLLRHQWNVYLML